MSSVQSVKGLSKLLKFFSMGRPAKMTLRYYMRSNGGGEIKAYLTFKGRRLYGGRTEIYTDSATFAILTTSGELKTTNCTVEQLDTCKLLQVLSKAVLADIKSKIKAEQEVTREIFQSAMAKGRAAVMEQRVIWYANREWKFGEVRVHRVEKITSKNE